MRPGRLAPALLVLLAGCTGGAPSEGPTSAATGDGELPYGSRYHLPAEYAEHEPAYRESIANYIADHRDMGLEEPPADAAFVRFIRPDEWTAVYAQCFEEQGFPVTVTLDGGIDFTSIAADQQPALLEADFRCFVQYPIDPKYTAPLTQEQVRITYEYYVNELVPCLEREGYPTDPGVIPSWETYLATWEDVGSWFPYAPVTDRLLPGQGGVAAAGSDAEWNRINEVCPQAPPLERLYPDED